MVTYPVTRMMRTGRLRGRREPSCRCGRGHRHLLLVHHHRRVVRGRGRRRRYRWVRRVRGVRDRRVRGRVNSGVAMTVMVRRRRRRRRGMPRRAGVVLLMIVQPVFDRVARRMARRDDPVVIVPRARQLLPVPDVARGDEGGGRRGSRHLRRWRGQVGLVPRRRPAPRRRQLRRNDLSAAAGAADRDGRDGGARRGPGGTAAPFPVGGGPVRLLTALRRRVGRGGHGTAAAAAGTGRILSAAYRNRGEGEQPGPDSEEVVAALDEPVDRVLEVSVLLLQLVQGAE